MVAGHIHTTPHKTAAEKNFAVAGYEEFYRARFTFEIAYPHNGMELLRFTIKLEYGTTRRMNTQSMLKFLTTHLQRLPRYRLVLHHLVITRLDQI